MALATAVVLNAAPHAAQSAAREAGVFAEVGLGGLLPSDFQLVQQLARLSVQQARHSPPLPPAAAAAAGMPRQMPSSIHRHRCHDRKHSKRQVDTCAATDTDAGPSDAKQTHADTAA